MAGTNNSHPPEVAELLSARAGEAMALNQRHLNPQLGRILRTLGFDRDWVEADGSHLIDRDGQRYLDLLGRLRRLLARAATTRT